MCSIIYLGGCTNSYHFMVRNRVQNSSVDSFDFWDSNTPISYNYNYVASFPIVLRNVDAKFGILFWLGVDSV